MIWVILGAVVVVIGLALIALARRRNTDGVETFQRHIDALSPEARRPVVNQVQQLDDEASDASADADEEERPDGP